MGALNPLDVQGPSPLPTSPGSLGSGYMACVLMGYLLWGAKPLPPGLWKILEGSVIYCSLWCCQAQILEFPLKEILR